MASFTHVAQDISPQYGLQGGSIATGWVGHVSEIQWTEDG